MNQLVKIFHKNTSFKLDSINFMVVNLCYEFRVIDIRADSIKHSIQSQHLITYMIHRYFTRKPIREKPLLLMMSKASMGVHYFLFEHRLKEAATSECKHRLKEVATSECKHRLKEAATSECKHQLAESTNSHCNPAPTGLKHQLPV